MSGPAPVPAAPDHTRPWQRWLAPFTRRLDVRIVTLFLGLLLVVQLATVLSTRQGIENNARQQIGRELETGESVLRHLLQQNADTLQEAARLLAADFGFRAAVATGDALTLVDALDNQGSRIGADIALFTDARHDLVATTLDQPDEVLALVRSQLSGAQAAPVADATVRVVGGLPFQLVTVPVRAPQLIGHVTMGFPVGAQLPRDLRQLSGLAVGLLSRPIGGAWTLLPIGDQAVALRELPAQLGEQTQQVLRIDGETQGARLVPLGRSDRHEIAAVLLRSVDGAVAQYDQLQLTLLLISLLGVAVFAIGSVLTARNITGPIRLLRHSAERLGQGDYSTEVSVASRDEVRELAQSFEAMRLGMREREAQISRLAYWDALTGLPNRERFRMLLREDLQAALHRDEPYAVLMLDLDRFKHVNDVLGHAFGDRLLRQIALRLQSGVLRPQDRLARLGGDEFVIGLPAADADTALGVAQRLRRALEEPLNLDDHTVDVGAGVGVATFPGHGRDADVLMGRAEVAMYSAKARQAGVTLYDAGLDSASAESLSLLSELRTAVDHDQLRLFLQPKVELAGGRVLGAEALVRWQHPLRGMVAPMRFIPFAEQTGFIRVLTGWMIEQCAARSRELQAEGLPMKFAINLSTRDLLDQDLPAKLERLLAQDGMDPRLLCMEITESAIMDDPQRALQTLNRLHAMGLKLSIDDFGTGYSSLAYLKQLPVHELKIDRSFVMHMESDRADLKIVRSTIDLAHNLGLSVVAEGVENAKVWALLKALKCDEVQGYYIAKPMPEAEFGPWLRHWKAPQARLDTEFAEFV